MFLEFLFTPIALRTVKTSFGSSECNRVKWEISLFNPIALRTAKPLWSLGHSECNRFNVKRLRRGVIIFYLYILQTFIRDNKSNAGSGGI